MKKIVKLVAFVALLVITVLQSSCGCMMQAACGGYGNGYGSRSRIILQPQLPYGGYVQTCNPPAQQVVVQGLSNY